MMKRVHILIRGMMFRREADSRRLAVLVPFLVLLVWLFSPPLQAQQSDTSRVERKPLPEIQLQEYTIVGLERIRLPQKERVQIFRNVALRWVPNRSIWQKQSPQIGFRFSRVKPSLLRLYEFPWLNGWATYGSFNTTRVGVQSQFKLNHFLPYFAARFGRSDGWRPNAQWTESGMRAGFHHQFRRGHQLSLGTNYSFARRGIFHEIITREQESLKTETTSWNMNAELRQQWHTRFRTLLQGEYHTDAYTNQIQYDGKGTRLSAEFRFLPGKNTTLFSRIAFQEEKITFSDPHTSEPLSELNSYYGRILSARLGIQYQWKMMVLKAALHYQNVWDDLRAAVMTGPQRHIAVQPEIFVSTAPQYSLGIYAAYRPGFRLTTLNQLTRLYPFANFEDVLSREDEFRLEFGAYYQQNAHRYLRFHTVMQRGSHLPVTGYLLYEVHRSPTKNSSTLSLPYFSMLNRFTLNEFTLRGEWEVLKHLRLQGWGLFRQSKVDEFVRIGQEAWGRQVPYLPNIELRGGVEWEFWSKHLLRINLQYIGSRFVDLSNQEKLDPYVLLNAEAEIHFAPHLRLILSARNILNQTPYLWQDMPRAGFEIFGGLRVVF